MDDSHLYQRISEQVRTEILTGMLKPGSRLPAVRQMASRWGCTIGTVQRAYQELAQQGLVTVRPGQGTHVVDRPPVQGETPLRRAALVHRAEAFLLETLTAGHSPDEVERALRLAMDRWRSIEDAPEVHEQHELRFAGSHDPAVAWLAGQFAEIAPGYNLQIRFCGSLAGLISLAEGKADLAGSHLWDQENQTYNEAFVRRLFPGQSMALITVAHRRMGLILPPGNPRGIRRLSDLAQPGLRFVNRQPGSGTRVWLDNALQEAGLRGEQIDGYTDEKSTHTAVAQAVAEGQAGAGFGLETASLSFGLDFIPLTSDRYDLVLPRRNLQHAAVQGLASWLRQPANRKLITRMGGYETHTSGEIGFVE
jgi:molybdate-binding protein/DNA-binding transcriptional regulator YhcF (GntR family)